MQLVQVCRDEIPLLRELEKIFVSPVLELAHESENLLFKFNDLVLLVKLSCACFTVRIFHLSPNHV